MYLISSKMLLIVRIILICFQLYIVFSNDLYSKFQQKDYILEFTRLETNYYNKNVFNRFEVVTFKYNRSLAVANVTYQSKVHINSSKVEVVFQVYKFLSNEYRIFPIRFQLNLCRLTHQNIAGVFDIVSRCGNINDCNIKKDVLYHACNIYPDQSRLPPFIPSGEFKVEVTLVEEKVTNCAVNAYGKVSRPIKYQ